MRTRQAAYGYEMNPDFLRRMSAADLDRAIDDRISDIISQYLDTPQAENGTLRRRLERARRNMRDNAYYNYGK